jgi:hypothetical protein
MKKVENNPCIPLSEKLAVAQEMVAKTKNILKAEQKFMQSAQYAKLPTEAEEAKERAEETEYENEQDVEQLKEITDDSDIQTEEDDADSVSDETSENSSESDSGTDFEFKTESDSKAVKILEDIQDSYERIALNSRLDKATESDSAAGRADSEINIQRKSGHKLDLTV